jgi:hypothetical protein
MLDFSWCFVEDLLNEDPNELLLSFLTLVMLALKLCRACFTKLLGCISVPDNFTLLEEDFWLEFSEVLLC